MTRYRRSAEVLSRRMPDRVLLLATTDEEVVSLSGTGTVLWDLLAEPAATDELAVALASIYGADAAVVRRDIEPVLAELAERRLVLADDER